MVVTRSALLGQLERARTLGFLGDGPVTDQLDHAVAMLALRGGVGGGAIVDLGSGGGVPGLAWLLSEDVGHVTLVDRSARRAAFLRSALTALGATGDVSVLVEAAETAAWREELRGRCAVVTARSFAPPAVTLECGGGLLRSGGRFIIAEPRGEDRWSSVDLEPYGLRVAEYTESPVSAVVLERVGPWPPHLPRSERVTRKRPLW